MDVSGDHGLLVVSLENCSTDAARQLGKSNSCIYTAAMTNSPCGHETSVLQLATPVQCIGDVRQTLPRIQHQHLTQLQPLQYPQVSYEPNQQLHQHGNLISNHTLYQPMNVSAASIHHYTAPAQQSIHGAYITTGQTLHLTPTVPESFNPQPPPPVSNIEHSQNQESDSVIVNLEPDPSIEPTFPEDSYEYYKEIQCFLLSEEYPPGVSENYKKHLRKRAQHYTIIDGKLYHGRKQPKEVIMKKDEQQELLNQIHVIKETGVHLGVKKMFNKLHLKQFWRGMYIDVVTFVKNCDKCSDLVDVVRRRQTTEGPDIDEDEEEDVDDPDPIPPPRPRPTCLRTRSQCTDAPQVWRKVEVKLNGPYKKTSNRNEYVVSMADPDSRWFCARAIPSSGHPTHMAEFIFHTFCNYGFTRCVLVGVTNDLKEAISEDYRWRVRWLGEVFTTACLSSVELHQSQCMWVEPLLDLLIHAHPVKWDKELDHFLFQYRTGKLKEFSSPPSPTPFSVIFNHSPINSSMSDDDKENINESSTPRRRKLQSSVLQCRHCDETFTSKISFRIHQRKHTEDARKRGRESGEAIRKIRRPDGKRNRRGLPRLLKTSEGVQFKTPDTWVESTVSAVKALLVATKEERRRRGKYHKYTTELQEQMAAYAVQHGNPQAVRYFSERLGTMVSESTIRNLVKIHSAFTPLLKEEIGRFAANFGVEPASKYFSERLKRDVPLSLVRKFKTLHLNKFPDNSKRQRDKKPKKERMKKGLILKKSAVIGTGKAKRYSQKIKEEIGFYACHYSVAETVKHFSEKLQIVVKERTVKRFHKAYLEKCQIQNGAIPNGHVDAQVIEQAHPMNQPAPAYNSPFTQHINNTQAAAYQMNQCNSNTNNIPYQTPATSVIMTQTNSSFNYHTVNTIQNYPTSIPPPPMPPPPPLYPLQPAVIRHSEQQTPIGTITITQQDQTNPSCLLSQHPILVTQERHDSEILPHFMVSNQSAQHLQTQQAQQLQSQQIPQQAQQLQPQVQQLPQQAQQITQQQVQQLPQQTQQLLPQQIQQLPQQQAQQLPPHQQEPQQQLSQQQQQQQQLSQQQQQQLSQQQQQQQQQSQQQQSQQPQQQSQQPQQQNQQSQQHQQPQTLVSVIPLKELQSLKCDGDSGIVQNQLHHEFSTENFHQANQTNTCCIPVVTELIIPDEKGDLEEELIDESNQDSEVNINTNQRLSKACESTLASEGREKQVVCNRGNKNSNRKQGKKKESNSKKRGSYTTYSPELRAEIGKYAAEHGSLKACQYFSKVLGHDVPESTARGLKDKYLMKRKHCTVTSLGYSQRGRPLRLGKYDEVVQECLKELVRSGEKVSSFLAITTAKQILNKYDPGLLEDNGGPVKLNTTWAKSFLKRIGVHNNS